MNLDEYSRRFSLAARERGLAKIEIAKCLSYAQVLLEKDLPVIYDCFHFSRLVGYDIPYLFAAANAPEKFYRHFSIKKKSGAMREISEPLPSLKEIQRWILDNILAKTKISPYAKAFRPGYSIVDNARFHVRQDKVVTVDIKDFFPSIEFPRIYSQFNAMGYHRSLCILLAKLCCLDGRLPQGAPTSPALSNLVAGRLDRRIVGYTKPKGIRYTRYADDLTFSNVADTGALFLFLQSCVNSEGFTLNADKTRVLKKHNRQIVTGVVVNERISPQRQKVRRMRQIMYYIRKHGIEGHQQFIGDTEPWFISRIEGSITSLISVGLPHDIGAQWLAMIRKIRRGSISK